MNRRSAWAVLAGVLVVIVVTTLVDLVLHASGVYPPNQPLDGARALLAVAYRVVIGVGAGWLTARLAPQRPMRHAIILGAIGVVLGLVGLAATWNLGLGPRWYPISLVLLAIPQSWAGAKLFESRASRKG